LPCRVTLGELEIASSAVIERDPRSASDEDQLSELTVVLDLGIALGIIRAHRDLL
jgi:hypothetical protein